MDRQIRHTCDVLVIGSGVSGYCAAIQAGRLGCRTILVEKDEVLGGNSGPNLGVGITGADRYNPYATETGIVHQIQEEGAWVGGFTGISPGTMPYNISRRFEAVVRQFLEEAGVTVLKRHYAREPAVDTEGRITAVLCEDLAGFGSVRIEVTGVVIEASGDGEVGALAGAEFDMGSEAASEFGERSAPAERSGLVQGTSLVAIAHRTDRDVTFVAPPDLPPFRPRGWHNRIGPFVRHHDGMFSDRKDLFFLYVTETGGNRDTIRDDGAIYDDLLRQLWAEWDHIKNGPHHEEARCWDLLWVSPKAGKRESRRFLGDVILTQTDLENGRRFPDDIAWGGHDLDDHQPLGDGSNIVTYSVVPTYGIPLRACYSRNVPNLLLGGRLISATHVAHSSTRVMRTGGAIGQGIGVAAALCCQHACSPRDVFDRHLEELRAALFDSDGSIPGRGLRLPTDIAPSAHVSGTSQVRFNDAPPGDYVPLLARAGVLLWDWRPEIDTVSFFLRNRSDQAQELVLTVLRACEEHAWRTVDEFHRCGRNDLCDSAFAEVARTAGTVAGGFEGWHTFRFSPAAQIGEKDCMRDDDRLIVALCGNRNIDWALSALPCEIATMVEHGHDSAEWSDLRAMAALRLDPPPSVGEATNVTNGFKQRFSRGPTNMWVSDPSAQLPQDLTLTWEEPQEFGDVVIVFDNLTARRHDYPWERGARVLPALVKSYEIWCREDGKWLLLACEDRNHHRLCRHRFDPVRADALRLRVRETHGGPSARVYELRVMTGCASDGA